MNCFRRIANVLDLTSHNSGSDVLRLVFPLWGIGSSIKVLNSFMVSYKRTTMNAEEWIMYVTWVGTVTFLLNSIAGGWLIWKAIKTGSPKFLKYFLISNAVAFTFFLAVDQLLMYYDNFDEHFLRYLMNYVSKPILTVLYLYGVALIYKCYVKSTSPLIIQLYAHCSELRANEYTQSDKDCKRDSERKLMQEEKEEIMDELIVVTSNQFEKHIINPLDITIDFSQILGEGQFGVVYKGNLSRGKIKKQVAVKAVKNSENGDIFSLLLQEVKTLIRVGTHENIIGFYGITSDSFEHFSIIMEYCGGGNLEKFLRDNRHTFINLIRNSGINCHPELPLIYSNLHDHGTHSTSDLIKFAIDVAHGMEHLASKKIVHGDLAARNVILTTNKTAKLIDFGLSQRLYNYQQTYSKMLSEGSDHHVLFVPWRWMSLEAIQDLKFSEKSDSYAFGVLLWEIFTLGDYPYEKIEQWSPEIPQMIQSGQLRLERPKYSIVEIDRLMESCRKLDCYDRPTFTEILKVLSKFQNPTEMPK